jgi:hypothetical protein
MKERLVIVQKFRRTLCKVSVERFFRPTLANSDFPEFPTVPWGDKKAVKGNPLAFVKHTFSHYFFVARRLHVLPQRSKLRKCATE